MLSATLEDVRQYAPGVAFTDEVFAAALPRAQRWAERELARFAVVLVPANTLDVTDAVCAYALHLAGEASSLALASTSQTVLRKRLGDAEVQYADGATNAARMADSASAWLDRAWGHLYDAGVPRSRVGVGVAR